MTQQELKHILSSKFDFEQWKDLLGTMFLKIDYLSKPIQIDASLVKSGGQVGVIRLDDGRSLGLFKFEVADSIIIARNRKGLRDIAIKYVDQDILHGALVFYYSQNQADYRLTFVSKQTSINAEGALETKATAPKRFTFLLGENEPCTTAATRLMELVNKKKNGSVYLADVNEAFSVERLNKDFFNGYKDRYKKFLNYLNDDTKANRDYVKKLLGRLVFLQFLQKKGWMGVPAGNDKWEGGDKNYLLNLVQRNEGNARLLSDVLEVLFFNTLNEKRTDDIADSLLGENIKIPYLNGGLFDKDELDKKDIDFPYDYFKELMEFFAMYNFTIDENDPDDAEVGVDPEMLGHIFENLLEDNKDKGAFYTPKEIVQYMSEESIVQYLKTHTEEALHPAIDELIKQKTVGEILQNKTSATDVYKLLKEVKVCDPAIGSGAFPMGVLNVLYHSRLLLYGFTKPTQEFSPSTIKREIIQNNIYGVDIEQGAIDIARLRFWLALVVDELKPEPLPNLDFKIMQGNSLLEQFEGVDLKDLLPKANEDGLLIVFDEETQLQAILNAKQQRYFSTTVHEEKHRLHNEIIKVVKDLIIERTQGKTELHAKLQTLDLAENDRFFLWHTWFADVFKNGGFDVVIGNPPYGLINKKQNKGDGIIVPDEILALYKNDPKYEPAKGGMLNIFRLFVLQGGDILKTNGIFCEIFPLAFTCDLSSANLRKFVFNNYHVRSIEAFPERDNPKKRVFASAKMSVCILIYSKEKVDESFNLRINREPFVEENKMASCYTLQQITSVDNKNFTIPLTEPLESRILVKVYSISHPFSSFGKCYTGEVDMTFCKKAFTLNPNDCKVLRGAHVDRYLERKEISQGEIFYLDKTVLRTIKKGIEEKLFSSTRIVMQGITGVNEKTRLKMTLVNDTFCANSINYCLFDTIQDAKLMLSLFNSKLLNYIFKLLSTNSNVNGYEVDNLPIANNIPVDYRMKLIALVDQILAAKKQNPQADTSAWEREIDLLVYALYGLTKDEIKVVEGK